MFSLCPSVPLIVCVRPSSVLCQHRLSVWATRANILVQKWNSPQGGQVHYADAATEIGYGCMQMSADVIPVGVVFAVA